MELVDFYALLNGLWLTIVMAFFAASGAIIFGSILAVIRNYGHSGIWKILSYLAGAYIEIFRQIAFCLSGFAKIR